MFKVENYNNNYRNNKIKFNVHMYANTRVPNVNFEYISHSL